jgi:hypothetical protein
VLRQRYLLGSIGGNQRGEYAHIEYPVVLHYYAVPSEGIKALYPHLPLILPQSTPAY